MQKNKIVLTGGHAGTTAIAVIEELKERLPDGEIAWIGDKSAMPGSKVTTLEYKIYPKLGVEYHSIHAGKLQTKFTRYTIPLILLFPVGFVEAFFLLLKLKPKVILSFGGYTSLPVVSVGSILGIPVVIHEQTAAAGRATMAEAPFARKIALARSESRKYFPKDKCVVTGNPLRRSILSVKPIGVPHSPFTILVMGGSRGSEFINEEVIKVMPELTTKYKVVHIVGEREHEKYRKLESEMYKVLGFVDPDKIPESYKESDMIIARSGANSVSEIIYIKRPTIFIPLPRTFMDEQYKNAVFAKNFGIAEVMRESEVNSESLLMAVDNIAVNWQKYVARVSSKPSPDIHASERVVDILEKFL